MTQFARPSADALVNGWVDQNGSASAIYVGIDEVVAEDVGRAISPTTPVSRVYVAKLSPVTDPVSSVNHVVNFRYNKNVTSGDTISLVVELRQDYANEGSKGTLIHSFTDATVVGPAYTNGTFTLSGGEADSISNYASLYLRFVANKV